MQAREPARPLAVDPPPSSALAGRSWDGRAAADAAGVSLLAWLWTVLRQIDAGAPWRPPLGESDRFLQLTELTHYALLLLLGLPAAGLLAAAAPTRAPHGISRALQRAGCWLPAVLATAGACLVSRLVTQGAWFT